jgi:hypothetical protein
MRVEHGHPGRFEILSWTSGSQWSGTAEGHTARGTRTTIALESLMDGADTARDHPSIGPILAFC